ncbi:hypothetical protein PGT21_004260 [Puccinia graminis f. sp. tritici]|uniref:Uncharacterized protein n=1 Tax=Puccinia graminis f. sp. tritici TaxID=56615 RepID=A0A5B0N310_PUCGR|nr:hypothetical protein PGT21_004260 [Puccinia graminis f. sp. tritici]KAA1133639.1 hypothetical protein PGTUg99_029231 [Puccinia graminis f. sp. tritici]
MQHSHGASQDGAHALAESNQPTNASWEGQQSSSAPPNSSANSTPVTMELEATEKVSKKIEHMTAQLDRILTNIKDVDTQLSRLAKSIEFGFGMGGNTAPLEGIAAPLEGITTRLEDININEETLGINSQSANQVGQHANQVDQGNQ